PVDAAFRLGGQRLAQFFAEAGAVYPFRVPALQGMAGVLIPCRGISILTSAVRSGLRECRMSGLTSNRSASKPLGFEHVASVAVWASVSIGLRRDRAGA